MQIYLLLYICFKLYKNLKINDISVAFEISKLDKSKYSNSEYL